MSDWDVLDHKVSNLEHALGDLRAMGCSIHRCFISSSRHSRTMIHLSDGAPLEHWLDAHQDGWRLTKLSCWHLLHDCIVTWAPVAQTEPELAA